MMRDVLLFIVLMLMFVVGYLFVRRVDIRISAGITRKRKYKETKILTGDERDD